MKSLEPKQKFFNFNRSIEQESIIRKFSILFLLTSLIPMIVLFYFYVQWSASLNHVDKEGLYYALIFITLGVWIGYDTLRRMVVKLIDILDTNRELLKKILSSKKIKELSVTKNEISALAECFTVITSELENNVRELEFARQNLYSVMNKVAQGMSNLDNIDSFLDLILETSCDALSCKNGILFTYDPQLKQLMVRNVYGLDNKEGITDQKFAISDLPAIEKVFNGYKSNLVEGPQTDPLIQLVGAPFICAPLVSKDTNIGILVISKKMRGDFEETDKELLFNIASQTAVAIENSNLNKNIEETYFETISALALAVDAKDRYSRGHLERVAKYSLIIGQRMGLEDQELKILKDAATLHDLGKIGIPDEVLNKQEALNDQEWEMMRKHPQIGESILKPIKSLNHLCDLIRHHHEKLDGSGYPDNLSGDAISPLVRILAVADVFDAVTTKRSYRDKSNPEEACRILKEMGDKIDQNIVDVLSEYVESEGVIID